MTDAKLKKRRPFLSMHFRCCNIYTRIYINKKGTAFVGWCPKCTRRATVRVSPDGSDARFFIAE